MSMYVISHHKAQARYGISILGIGNCVVAFSYLFVHLLLVNVVNLVNVVKNPVEEKTTKIILTFLGIELYLFPSVLFA